MSGYELDRLELGHAAAVCAAVENAATMWRTGWWSWLCRQPANPPYADPSHASPWGPM